MGSWREKKALELVLFDIFGPITLSSNGGKSYVITFIANFTRKSWVYFLEVKFEAFKGFKSYKVLVEKEIDRPTKAQRSDHVGEYNSHEFAIFRELHEIKLQLTLACSPQQNGVCERKYCFIMNMKYLFLKRSMCEKVWTDLCFSELHTQVYVVA